MSDYDQDQDLYDHNDDERFYEETVYNEEYYIEQERELIRQSNLDLELEERERREMREEGLLRPVLIKPLENKSEAEEESPLNQPEIEIPF
jgi:tRNA(Glu) U13 pseudouridine synthase TruD